MKIMIPLAVGFEEIEALTVVDVLRRAGIEIDTIGITGSVVVGANGIRIMADKKLLEIKPDEYDGIILPGGSGYKNLAKSSILIKTLKDFNNNNKLIGAICAAPLILAEQGLLDERRATVYPGLEKRLAYPRGDKVIIDGNIITSQAPGTAMNFALAIVKKVLGQAAELKLREELVFHE